MNGKHFGHAQSSTSLIRRFYYVLSYRPALVNISKPQKGPDACAARGVSFCIRRCACNLHHIAGKEEALEWGQFRSGGVLIAGTDYEPPAAGDLPGLFTQMIDRLARFDDVYDQVANWSSMN